MKKIVISVALLLGLATTSCNYLDIVPDERPTEADAFVDARAAEKYLYSCYSYLPNSRSGTSSLDFMTADEVVTAFEHETFAHFPKGNYTSVSPGISYWNTLWAGIRQSWILIDNIDQVPNMAPENKAMYKAEAKFLIAYYHYLLLRCYGPVMIIDKVYDINTPSKDYPERLPYDECVNWIANMFDEAAQGLPKSQVSSSYGRATSIAAMALKSRMFLYQASPLFNGNTEYYSDFVSPVDGRPLMPLTYDASKWQKAADATKAAIDAAEEAGHELFYSEGPSKQKPQPTNEFERNVRYTFMDMTNTECIWTDTRGEGTYDLQNKSTPFQDAGSSWNGVAPTLNILETFYTKNGLPINVDPEWDFEKRYDIGEQPNGMGVTMNLNMDREPRFNTWICYHNSNFELMKYNRVDVPTGIVKMQFRKNDNGGIKGRTNDYSPTGYLNKKGVSPQYTGSPVKYAWPVIRLAELYLNYAEALVELNRLDEAKVYLDKIRVRAGIPTVDVAWAPTGLTLDQNRMREIVRQERTIELYLENQRFWDVRRWKLGDKFFNVKAKGMNIYGTTDADFFQVTEVVYPRRFVSPMHYLMPIPQTETYLNTKLAQNPGY
ncbi:MAG: RagB/SusD family nutrient uptake outer membrane protein [Bacteroidales bacterium]